MVVPFDEELLNPASIDVLLGDHLMIEDPNIEDLQRISTYFKGWTLSTQTTDKDFVKLEFVKND